MCACNCFFFEQLFTVATYCRAINILQGHKVSTKKQRVQTQVTQRQSMSGASSFLFMPWHCLPHWSGEPWCLGCVEETKCCKGTLWLFFLMMVFIHGDFCNKYAAEWHFILGSLLNIRWSNAFRWPWATSFTTDSLGTKVCRCNSPELVKQKWSKSLKLSKVVTPTNHFCIFSQPKKSQIHCHEVRRLLKKDLLIPKQRVEWCVVLELKQGHPDLSEQVLVINRPRSRQQLWLCRYGIVGTGKLAKPFCWEQWE